MLLSALAISGFTASAADNESVVKRMSLNGMINGNVCIDGLSGTYYVDEDFPDNHFLRITGLEVYVSRVHISMGADKTLSISLSLPSWLKMPTGDDLQVSITGPKLSSLTLSKGSDISVQGFYYAPKSLNLMVKGKSHLLFNIPVKTQSVSATVSSGSTLTINATQADVMNMTLSENSEGNIRESLISGLTIDANGGSTANVVNSYVKKANFNASDMSLIGYNLKPKSIATHTTRGGMVRLTEDTSK